MADFSGRLKELRNNKQLTQSEFGALFNLSKQTISGYEKGDNDPPIDTLQKFADFFGVTTDYLLGRNDHQALVPKTRKTMLTILQTLLPYSLIQDKQFIEDIQNGNFTDDELVNLFDSVVKSFDPADKKVVFRKLPPELDALKEQLKNLPPEQRKALLHYIIDDAL